MVLNLFKIGNHLFRRHSRKVSVDLKHIYLFDLKKVIQKEKRRIVQTDQAIGECNGKNPPKSNPISGF